MGVFHLGGQDTAARLAALDKSQAIIEFKMDGTIITANKNFLDAMGYSLEEIKGRHHSMFVELAFKDSAEYREFWAALNRGEYQAAQYKRIGKNGKEVWIEASYNPLLDSHGKPFKVVKYATDVSKAKATYADLVGKVDATNRSQAVIEFELDGTIITANENFLNTMGYSLAEIKGQHHRMFVAPEERDSPEYRAFWAGLEQISRLVEYIAGEPVSDRARGPKAVDSDRIRKLPVFLGHLVDVAGRASPAVASHHFDKCAHLCDEIYAKALEQNDGNAELEALVSAFRETATILKNTLAV
jgi:PAS domain S-box-containing protein